MPRPLRLPELTELQALCAAIELGSLGRAALRLGISQPALSKRIRSLEAIAGASLLERSSSGVSATPEGRRLYPEARKVIEDVEVIGSLLSGLVAQEPPIRLAVSHTIADTVLSAVLVTFEAGEGAQHHSIELTVSNSVGARSAVAAGQADLGIVAADPASTSDGLEEHELFEDEVIVAVPRSHRWIRRKEVPIAEFVKTPMVMRDRGANSRRVVEAALAEAGYELAEPVAELGNTQAVKRMAIERQAPALLSELAARGGDAELEVRRVEGLRFRRSFLSVSRSHAALSPTARRLEDLILSQLGQ